MSLKYVYRSRRNIHGAIYRLMIKTHNKTGLKYLCQSSRIDYDNYTGGKNNSAKKCFVDGIEFDCLKSAALYFGYETVAKRHHYQKLKKKHKVEMI